MIPGVKPGQLKDAKLDEKYIARTEAIILSMTPAERTRPSILNASRKRRIAQGSGTSVEAVIRLLKQYEQIQDIMKQYSKPGKKGKYKLPGMF
jgi:signal recognition particle subunit SRP54